MLAIYKIQLETPTHARTHTHTQPAL